MQFSFDKIKPVFGIALLFVFAIVMYFILGKKNNGIGQSLPDKVDFNYHIRPILSNNCFTCHGPDETTREAGLRLDTHDGATALLKTGNHAILPGKPNKSSILHRLTSKDESLKMPPPESNKSLSDREIKLIKKWIEQGAAWKKPWALIPPEDYTSSDKSSKQAGHPIDILIRKNLKKNGLKPASKASKEQLIRRLAFTLTGLPPRQNEMVLKDDYEKQIDHYLDSPHFGERWARHWMDLVRYADTRGHEFDYTINGAWHYRDYLIRAFNADVTYDQFVMEHLAGDLLSSPRFHTQEGFNESILGTAFFTLGEGTHSPVDIRKDEADRIDNMIDVSTKTFQALTVSCARCHDHKFDPIPTADYYALYGVFESTRFSIQPAKATLSQIQVIDTLQEINDGVKEWIVKNAANTIKDPKAVFTQLLSNKNQKVDTTIQLIGDFRNGGLNGWLSQGLAFANPNTLGEPIWHEKTYQLQGFAYGKISSKQNGKGMVGAVRSPTFTLEKNKLLVRAAGQNALIRIVIDNFQLIQNPIYGGLEKVLTSDTMEDHIFDLAQWKGRKAYIELANGHYPKAHVFEIPADAWIEAEYAFGFNPKRSVAPSLPHSSSSLSKDYLKNWLQNKATHQDVVQLNAWLQQGHLPRNLKAISEHLRKINSTAQQLRDTSIFAGVTRGDRINSPVFNRGDHNQLKEQEQQHRFLSCLYDSSTVFSSKKESRIQLAEAIISPSNPLTARVYVNRIWHHLFGRGLVKTVDNFGLQGSIPSHPELLDHLAIWFMENGWSTKALIRYIVSSQTFQTSTLASAKSAEMDPENILLQHFPVRRLEAEAIRDAILVTSGRFDSTLYGPSVPIHLTEFMKGRGRPKESGPLDGNGRRSIYLSIRRNFLTPFLLAFDMPVPFSTFGKRNNSNVPAQSLTLMNDPFVAEQAGLWAKSVIAQSEEETERIQLLFQSAFCRKASTEEIETAKAFIRSQAIIYELEDDQIGNDLGLWADLCHSIFNMKEFVFLI